MNSTKLVFDLGNVLFAFDFSIAWGKILQCTSYSAKELDARLRAHEKMHIEYESGRVDSPTFFKKLVEVTGFQGSLAEIEQHWTGIFTPIHKRFDWIHQLAQGGQSLAILSNTNVSHIKHLSGWFPKVFAAFDHRIYSYEVGAMKPEAAIYEALEQATGVRGADLLFFDDRLDNVEAARSRGWQAHQVQPEDDLIPFLSQL